MAQRSPLNDRYKGDGPEGKTRRSASSAKPKRSSAAPSTTRDISKLSARQQALVRREQARARRKQSATVRSTVPYVVPTSPEYKRFRTWWWICLGIGVVITALTWAIRAWVPGQELAAYVLLGFAYVAIGVALYLDFFKIRPLRKAAQQMAAADKAREAKRTSDR